MKVTVKLGAPLSQVVGAAQISLLLPEGSTIGQALDELRGRYPRFQAGLEGQVQIPGWRPSPALAKLSYALFLNARPVAFERADTVSLHDGDRLYLFLPVAGG